MKREHILKHKNESAGDVKKIICAVIKRRNGGFYVVD